MSKKSTAAASPAPRKSAKIAPKATKVEKPASRPMVASMLPTAMLEMLHKIGGQVRIEFVKVNGTVRQYSGKCLAGKCCIRGCFKFNIDPNLDNAGWRGSRLDTISRLAVYTDKGWKLAEFRSLDVAKANAAKALAARGQRVSGAVGGSPF